MITQRTVSTTPDAMGRRRCRLSSSSPGGRSLQALNGVIVLTLLLAIPTAAEAQRIDGVLLDRGTGEPIDLALVTLMTTEGDSVAAALTDGSGRFRVEASDGGEYLLAATALGFRSKVANTVFELPPGSAMSIEFRLESVPVDIGGLVVEVGASLRSQPNLVTNGFVERAQTGMGRFITPADIAESAAFSTTELLTRTGRVTTRYQFGGDRILMRSFGGFCTPHVYVDGARFMMDAGGSLDAFAPLEAIDAIEVYRSPVEAPAQFAVGLWRCGVVVIWTKTR